MKKCLVCFVSQNLGREVNPKNYPFADELILLLKKEGFIVSQLGIKDEEKLKADDYVWDKTIMQLKDMIKDYDLIISVDTFLQHLCWFTNKQCVVLFSQSDPIIFGHAENINLLKDNDYLRKDTYGVWNHVKYSASAFLFPSEIIDLLKEKGVI